MLAIFSIRTGRSRRTNGSPAGQTNLRDSKLHGDADETLDLLEAKQVLARFKLHRAFRHAVEAADIAAIGDANPEIVVDAPEAIDERRHCEALMGDGNKVRRRRGALPKEILLHLLNDEFLGVGRTEIEPILIHEHLQMLHPTLPGFLRNVVVNALTEGVSFERNLVETFGFLLQFDAENTVRSSSHRYF